VNRSNIITNAHIHTNIHALTVIVHPSSYFIVIVNVNDVLILIVMVILILILILIVMILLYS